MDALMWLAVVLSVGGGFFVASERPARRQLGFYVWTLSNSMWIYDAVTHKNWPLLAMFAIYLIQCFIGIYSNRAKPGEPL